MGAIGASVVSDQRPTIGTNRQGCFVEVEQHLLMVKIENDRGIGEVEADPAFMERSCDGRFDGVVSQLIEIPGLPGVQAS